MGAGREGGYRICDMSESVWVWIDCSEKCRVASKELRVRGKRAPASPEKKKQKKNPVPDQREDIDGVTASKTRAGDGRLLQPRGQPRRRCYSLNHNG